MTPRFCGLIPILAISYARPDCEQDAVRLAREGRSSIIRGLGLGMQAGDACVSFCTTARRRGAGGVTLRRIRNTVGTAVRA
jgi:hypothetical protein